MKNKKFYEFKNEVWKNSLDIMLYGEIISGGLDSKWDSTDVTFQDFKDALDQIGTLGNNINTINIYINSVGGSVMTTQGIVAMLQRVKAKGGITINSYIDGMGASCASFLPMISDNIYAYQSSLLMLHKPMNIAMGNADDFQNQINVLNKVEDSVMIPLYMSKAKDGVTEQQIKDLLSAETWLNATEMSDLFDITILEESKDLVACWSDKNVLNKYKNTPQEIKDLIQIVTETEEKTETCTKVTKVETDVEMIQSTECNKECNCCNNDKCTQKMDMQDKNDLELALAKLRIKLL